MGDIGCGSVRAPRLFWRTSVLSLTVEGVSGCHAEEGDGQAGVDASWRLGEHRVQVWEGVKSHLGAVSHWWLHRCHRKGASEKEAEVLIAGNLPRA